MVSDDIVFHPTQYRYSFTEEEIEFANSFYDFFILPMADALRPDNAVYLKGITNFIKKLSIPCVVIGIGLRADYHADVTNPLECDSIVYDFIRAVLDKSNCVGIRGERTATYLAHLGFVPERDFTVIGCPSVSVFVQERNLQLPTFKSKSIDFDKIIFIANTLAPSNVNSAMINAIADWSKVLVVAQKEMEQENLYLGNLSGIYKGKFGCENIFGNTLYQRLYSNGQIRTFTNLFAWLNEIRNGDYCISSRFHGGIASLAAGIPTVIIPFDSRSRELCEYHHIPAIPYQYVYPENFVEQLKEINYNSHNSVLLENKKHYIGFLDRNGLDNIFHHEYLDATPYDTALRGVDWLSHDLNYSEISSFQKIRRIIAYYFGKAEHKVYGKKMHSIIIED